MEKNSSIAIFENKHIRTHWNFTEEQWYFSVIDVIEILTGSLNPRDYWFKMKTRVKSEDGFELSTICRQFKLKAADEKMRTTDIADTQSLFRIIQSIPSPKAEPFKQWLARVGYERIQEINDPSQGIDRARDNWQKMGHSEKWIQQRMSGQETRNKLTDYWKEAGISKNNEFALLTNIIHKEWSGLTVGHHKAMKGLQSQNLRDHMSEAELLFTALAELSTRQIAEAEEAKGLLSNAKAGKQGGSIAKNARLELESKTGKSVVNTENFLPPSKKVKHLSSKSIKKE